MNKSTSFDEFFSSQLNDNQQKAVAHTKGILVICAGAGSGKTRVITARIANLIIRERINPAEIIALTFTNKAGREMKDRIKHFLPFAYDAHLPFVGTFHSYCLRLLKSNFEFFDPSFSLFDDDDQGKLIKTILKKLSIDKKITPGKALAAISHIKNYGLELDAISDPLIRTLYSQYEAEKSASRSLDFDDLLLEVLKLFRKHTPFTQRFHEQVRHVLVDEYQDTNHVQHELLKRMALCQGTLAIDSVCVVGDEDQSIYSWRGATVSNILDFANDFPEVTTITIDQNYRSVTSILETANHVIKHNHRRREKRLWSEREAQDRVLVLQCASEHHESEILATAIKQAIAHYHPSHVAVLYRSHYQSRAIEESLVRHAISYKIVGGIQFYERQEIKDLLAYARLAVNPFDRLSFNRVINTPSRGLGQKFVEDFVQIWNEYPDFDFKQAAEHLLADYHLTNTKETALKEFLALYHALDVTCATQCIEKIITAVDYKAYIRSAYEKDEAQAKLENIQEFVQALYYFQQQGVTMLADILDEIALMQEMSTRNHDDACVKLMTIHAAKGLEFACVLLVGLEDGVLPSSFSLFDAQLVEEERRLMYVALTRAQERILMTHARFRTTYGQSSAQNASKFLQELPNHYVQHQDASHWSSHELNNHLKNWFFGTVQPAVVEQPIIKPQAYMMDLSRNQVTSWKKNQPITHPHFGLGMIEEIEQKSNEKILLTIRFKRGGTKKIDAAFFTGEQP